MREQQKTALGEVPVEEILHSTLIHLLEANKIPPRAGFDAAMSAAINVGITRCYYDDATMERVFRDWLARCRAVQHETGGSA